MLARGTPPQLESNAKMSVKPHNIYLFPRLPDFFFLLEEGKGGGGGGCRHDTSNSIPGSLFFPVRGCNDSTSGKFHYPSLNW